jgi:MoaA/NifB/PqqE/SkfB family radical SAM enzyme
MNDRIIKIVPTVERFSITWMLGAFCNYDCMYCPTEFHDTTSKPHELTTMQDAWTNIYNKSNHLNLLYKISFTGGEVTANKNFLPLVSWLRDNYPEIVEINITTNGSASANYYTKLAAVVESITFSVHSEFINEQDFFDKTKIINKLLIRPTKSFHVNIMNEYWNQERIEQYKKWLDLWDISYTVNDIDYTVKIRDQHQLQGVYNLVKIS